MPESFVGLGFAGVLAAGDSSSWDLGWGRCWGTPGTLTRNFRACGGLKGPNWSTLVDLVNPG
ncbi:hypothetical protein KFK09_023396 [Dendrobium nobile]|uniref:Uncharacterized protein n=1 Tax=Dendrobium nobile TaxID=94219 RepID=A0A8T3AM29_DENNO|nr:hypothetical protein KFK09_023396 [Dendrobium nobile]